MTAEEILVLQKDMTSNKDKIIEAFIPLALSIASRYILYNHSKKDDITSSALYGLIRAVNNFKDQGKLISGYICYYVIGQIQHDLKNKLCTNYDFDAEGHYYELQVNESLRELIKKLSLTTLEKKILRKRLRNCRQTNICKQLRITPEKYKKKMKIIRRKGCILL